MKICCISFPNCNIKFEVCVSYLMIIVVFTENEFNFFDPIDLIVLLVDGILLKKSPLMTLLSIGSLSKI